MIDFLSTPASVVEAAPRLKRHGAANRREDIRRSLAPRLLSV